MIAKKYVLPILLMVILAALILAGCTPGAGPIVASTQPEAEPISAETKPEGTLIIALTNDIAGITPSNAPEWQAGIAAAAFFDGFFDFNPETSQYEPLLAESCESSADLKTFTLKLKEGIQFHNGEPVNADAIVFTYATLSKAQIAYPYPGEDVVTVEKVDEYTVNFHTADPSPGWCYNAPSDIIPPKHVQEVGLDAYLQKPVGTGEFMVEEWIRGSHVTGVYNPNYWREGYPKVEKVMFKMIPDAATRIAALKTGEVHIITRLTAEDADTLRNDPNIVLVEYAVNRVYYVTFGNLCPSCKDSPILDKDVRLALNYAVDRQAIIDALFAGKGRLPAGFVTPGDIGHDKNLQPYPFDPEKAREMLDAAGYPEGFEIDMACPDGAYSHINEVCQAVAGYLEEVGVVVHLEFMESGKFWDLEGKQELPPLFVDSWSSGGNPMGRIDGSMGKNGAYRSWWDERIQNFIDKLNATDDIDEVNQLYADLQKLMYEEPPFIYLYEPYTFEAISNQVVNHNPRSNEYFSTHEISLRNP
jgi:peptide/nickel transport system substrate-binding protein